MKELPVHLRSRCPVPEVELKEVISELKLHRDAITTLAAIICESKNQGGDFADTEFVGPIAAAHGVTPRRFSGFVSGLVRKNLISVCSEQINSSHEAFTNGGSFTDEAIEWAETHLRQLSRV